MTALIDKRHTGLVLALAGLAAFAALPPLSSAQEKGAAALEGKWIAVSLTADGKEHKDEGVQLMTLHFRGDKLTVSVLDKKQEGTFRIDAGKKPAHIDIEQPDQKRRSIGIYKIEKDVLTICYDETGEKRPTAFQALPGTTHVLLVLKRGEAKP